MAESKLTTENLTDVVTVLDSDLNLHLFIVNEQKKCFELL